MDFSKVAVYKNEQEAQKGGIAEPQIDLWQQNWASNSKTMVCIMIENEGNISDAEEVLEKFSTIPDSECTLYLSPNLSGSLTANNLNHVSIKGRGCRFNGTLTVNNSTDVLIENINFINGKLILNKVEMLFVRPNVKDCIFKEGEEGLIVGKDCKEIEIKGNKFIELDTGAIYQEGINCTFKENTFAKCKVGFLVEKSVSGKIQENRFFDNEEYGIKILESKDLEIRANNEGYNNGIAGMYIENSENIITRDTNKFYNNKKYGVYLKESKKLALNQIEAFRNELYGHYIYKCEDSYIGGNSYENGTYGVYIEECNEFKDFSNEVHDNGLAGDYVFNSKKTLIGNHKLYNNPIYNIHIKNSQNTSVNNCKIYDSKYGIRIERCKDSDISGLNEIGKHEIVGVFFDNTNIPKCYNNKIYDSPINIRILNCTDAEIVNNTITNSPNYAILLEKIYGGRIGNNIIENGNNIGISLEDSCYGTNISDNTISKINKYAISISEVSDNNKIANNKIFENYLAIYLKGIKGTIISGNKIYDNETKGIELNNGCEDIIITTNKIYNNKIGIDILATGGTCAPNNPKNNIIENNEMTNHTITDFIDIQASSSSSGNIIFNNRTKKVITSNRLNDVLKLNMTEAQLKGYKKNLKENLEDEDIQNEKCELIVLPIEKIKNDDISKEDKELYGYNNDFIEEKLEENRRNLLQKSNITLKSSNLLKAPSNEENNNLTNNSNNMRSNFSSELSNLLKQSQQQRKAEDEANKSKEVPKTPKTKKKENYLSLEKAEAGMKRVLGKYEKVVKNIGEPVAGLRSLFDGAEDLNDLTLNKTIKTVSEVKNTVEETFKKLNSTTTEAKATVENLTKSADSLKSSLGSLDPKNIAGSINNIFSTANKIASDAASSVNKLKEMASNATQALSKFANGKGKNDEKFFESNSKGGGDGEVGEKIKEINELRDKKAEKKADNTIPPNKEKFKVIVDSSESKEQIQNFSSVVEKTLSKYKRKIEDMSSLLGDTKANIENPTASGLLKLGFNLSGGEEGPLSGLLSQVNKTVESATSKFKEFQEKVSTTVDKATKQVSEVGIQLNEVKKSVTEITNGTIDEYLNKIEIDKALNKVTDPLKNATKEVKSFVNQTSGKMSNLNKELSGVMKNGNSFTALAQLSNKSDNLLGFLGNAKEKVGSLNSEVSKVTNLVSDNLSKIANGVNSTSEKYLKEFSNELTETLSLTGLKDTQAKLNFDKFTTKTTENLNNIFKSTKNTLETVKNETKSLVNKVESIKLKTDIKDIEFDLNKNKEEIFGKKIKDLKNNLDIFNEEISVDKNINEEIKTNLSTNLNNLKDQSKKISNKLEDKIYLDKVKENPLHNLQALNGNIFSDGNSYICNEACTKEIYFLNQSYGKVVDKY